MTTRHGVPLEEARRIIARGLPEPRLEEVELAAAVGRVLARDVVAEQAIWPFDRAAMDGVALHAADVRGATPDAPVVLPVVGALYCGDEPTGSLAPGTAMRVATGAAIPHGADAVVRQELVDERGDAVSVNRPVPAGQHIFPAGEDVRAGELTFRRGTVLHGGHIGLLAAMGLARVAVFRRVRVAIVVSGDELVAPEAELRMGRVRDSNSYALAAEISLLGALPHVVGRAGDDPNALLALVREGLEADCLVAAGGLSVGRRDFLRPALRAAGVIMAFEGVAIKPGHPAAFGVVGDRPVFALPGTPGACRVAYEALVRSALLALMGRTDVERPALDVRLAHEVKVRPGRDRFLWARLTDGAGGPWAEVLSSQGSAVLRSAADADLLLHVTGPSGILPAGSGLRAWLLDTRGLDAVRSARTFAAALAVVGQRNAGKTTLIEQLLPRMCERGLRVGVLKHHAHQDTLDEAGTDTSRALAAGAARTVLAGDRGTVVRVPSAAGAQDAGEPPGLLTAGLRQMSDVDLVLVEGFAGSSLPKVLVRRNGVAGDRPEPSGPILAVVGDPLASDPEPHFSWNEIDALTTYLVRRTLS